MPVIVPLCVYSPIAIPNQANTAKVKASDIAYALNTVPAIVLVVLSVQSHGASTTKPSIQPDPPQANRPDRTALKKTANNVQILEFLIELSEFNLFRTQVSQIRLVRAQRSAVLVALAEPVQASPTYLSGRRSVF